MLEQVTPLIITYNEAPNIRRVLDKLAWAKRIVIVDSGSTDETLDIVSDYPQTEVIQRKFDDFASQCNFGLTHVKTTWVLSLDADYELSDEFIEELRTLAPIESEVGFRARFIYRIWGRPLRGTLYPPRIVLYRKDEASYRVEGHGHRVVVGGSVGELRGVIYHDDRKPVTRFIASQQRYAREEAAYLFQTSETSLSRTDRIRRMGWPGPIAVLFYTLFAKGCIMDGLSGWHYALQRLAAETLIALEVVDRRLQGKRCKKVIG
jgi:glycosyltransferase involved in cell wall biosynthesis